MKWIPLHKMNVGIVAHMVQLFRKSDRVLTSEYCISQKVLVTIDNPEELITHAAVNTVSDVYAAAVNHEDFPADGAFILTVERYHDAKTNEHRFHATLTAVEEAYPVYSHHRTAPLPGGSTS